MHATLPLLALFMVACAHVPERKPLPAEEIDEATVLGAPRGHMWGTRLLREANEWLDRTAREPNDRHPAVYGKRQTYLAISSGGENGAFAAGPLLGWIAAGDRPECSVAT